MKTQAIGMLMALFVALTPVVAQDSGQEVAQLQGSWTVLTAEREGKPTDVIKGDKLVISGTNYTIKTKKGTEQKGTISVNAAANPKTIDLIPADGPQKDKPMLGIYALEGETLRICWIEPPGKDRPTAFVTRSDSRLALAKFQRDKQ